MADAGPSCIFLLTGEGAHSADTDLAELQASPSWSDVEDALRKSGLPGVDDGLSPWLRSRLGSHRAPDSPLVTTIINILNADRWRAAGHRPCAVLGHSIGEVAAAYVAGLLCLPHALDVAISLGLLGASFEGAMVHALLTRTEVDAWANTELCIAAINGVHSVGDDDASTLLSVSLCSRSPAHVTTWLAEHPSSKRLMPPHPWHHPRYLEAPGVLPSNFHTIALLCDALPESSPTVFVSTVRGRYLDAARRVTHGDLDAAYWRAWLSTPVDFAAALEHVAASSDLALDEGVYLIETGAHPVLTPVAAMTLTAAGVAPLATAASMRRGQPRAFAAH
jgi:acyl transferase domain-containing protein